MSHIAAYRIFQVIIFSAVYLPRLTFIVVYLVTFTAYVNYLKNYINCASFNYLILIYIYNRLLLSRTIYVT